jgi:hypothetical protein
MYRSQLKSRNQDGMQDAIAACSEAISRSVAAGALMTATLYRHETQLFLYYECIAEEMEPGRLLEPLDGFLESWPGSDALRKWVPMYDIFHYDAPTGPEHWKRKRPVDKRVGRIARIKPEMLGSYIFYHYQLQEEYRETGNKYCIIGLYENLIFHYEEHPVETAAPSFRGSLGTSNTPGDWKKLMDPHFIQWENAAGDRVNFIVLEPVISF